jgi:hypothetical protein
MELEIGILRACDWLINIAQVKTPSLPPDTADSTNHKHPDWRGAIRGEYSVSKKQWDFFCPVWHTGQAVKALVLAGDYFKKESYLSAARLGATFIFNNQIWDENHPDHGLILAYEDYGDKVTTSAILEAMHGVILYAQQTTSCDLWARMIRSGEFLIDKLYIPEKGLFHDLYDPQTHSVVPNPYRTRNNIGGRPLIDDGIFLILYQKTGEKKFLDVHVRIAETLVAEQDPPGNWIDYGPCNSERGNFHPRHTYWWGLPMIETYRITGRREFLDVARASGEFLTHSLRKDGGYFRGYYRDGNTDSFGHATSGSACAAILFLELFVISHEPSWKSWAEKALEFCLNVQFQNPVDPNLTGAILEKVLPPDGTDRSPYHIRDLGTIFFVIAGIKYLQLQKEQVAQ